MSLPVKTIFISANSNEFKSHRIKLASSLRRDSFQIIFQEDRAATVTDTLSDLDRVIQSCDLMIHLIGVQSGKKPAAASVKWILQEHTGLQARFGLSDEFLNAMTYTQWEFWLAAYHNKPVILAQKAGIDAGDEEVEYPNSVKDAIAQARQQLMHLNAIHKIDHYSNIYFVKHDELISRTMYAVAEQTLSNSRRKLHHQVWTYVQYTRTLETGFRSYLSERSLPYVYPALDKPFHPHTLVNRLKQSPNLSCLMLEGVGGVGKTRTSYEVAKTLQAEGWYILFVQPGAPEITIDDICETLEGTTEVQTLLIFEYIDQMSHIDIAYLQRKLASEGISNVCEVKFLANCRPGYRRTGNVSSEKIHTVIITPSDDEAAQIASQVIRSAAPKAVGYYGENIVANACGKRPIIALLIARQIEEQHCAGTLTQETLTNVPPGALLSNWIDARLQQDLNARTEKTGEQATNLLVATAAVFAYSPDAKERLVDTVHECSKTFEGDPIDAEDVVLSLLKTGWIEIRLMGYPESEQLDAIHDVVTDELLNETLFKGGRVNIKRFNSLLACATKDAYRIGRVTIALKRLLKSITHGEASELKRAYEAWLVKHIDAIGDALLNAEQIYQGSYALAALHSEPLLVENGDTLWNKLVAPWLNIYGESPGARHILYSALRKIRKSPRLSQTRNGTDSAAIIDAAMAWVHKYKLQPYAQSILSQLLYIKGSRYLDISEASSAWLDEHGTSSPARFVLSPLLWDKSTPVYILAQTVRRALNWLDDFGDTIDAHFVLVPLFRNKLLPTEQVAKYRGALINWVRDFGAQDPEAYALNTALSLRDLSDDDTKIVGKAALEWLKTYNHLDTAAFIVKLLLFLKKKPREIAVGITEVAAQYPTLFTSDLTRLDLFLKVCITNGIEINKTLYKNIISSYVARQLSGAEENTSFPRMSSSRKIGSNEKILRSLLWDKALMGEDLLKIFDIALANLSLRSIQGKISDAQMSHSLNTLLNVEGLDENRRGAVASTSLTWLSTYPSALDAKFVLKRLLSMHDVSVNLSRSIVECAMARVRQDEVVYPKTLSLLLCRRDLTPEEIITCTQAAIRWIRETQRLLAKEECSLDSQGSPSELALVIENLISQLKESDPAYQD